MLRVTSLDPEVLTIKNVSAYSLGRRWQLRKHPLGLL